MDCGEINGVNDGASEEASEKLARHVRNDFDPRNSADHRQRQSDWTNRVNASTHNVGNFMAFMLPRFCFHVLIVRNPISVPAGLM